MTTKKLIISYRQNENHERLIPLIQSVVTDRISKDIVVTLIEYPRDTLREAIEEAVSLLYPNLENGVTYLSDYTSRIPYKVTKTHPDIKVSEKYLEEMYRRVLGLNSTHITHYEECEDKSEIELREFADKDIAKLAEEISIKLNNLDEIKKVELITDRISHHIASLGALKRSINLKEGVSYKTDEKRYYEIESEVDNEFGRKMFEKIKEACPSKEVVVNDMIDSTWERLDRTRRDYLESLDLESNCIIIDGHNRLGNPNYKTEFTFTKALTVDPSGATVGCSMESENRNDWENRIMSTENRLSQEQLEDLFMQELTKIFSKDE